MTLDHDEIASESGGKFEGLFYWLKLGGIAGAVSVVCVSVSVFIAWGMR